MTATDRLLIRLFVNNTFLLTRWHCHRLPERSFRVRNRQFVVCARCTGLFTGLLAAPVLWPVAHLGVPVLIAATVGNLIDGGTQLAGLRKSANGLRLLLGLALGAGLTLSILNLLRP